MHDSPRSRALLTTLAALAAVVVLAPWAASAPTARWSADDILLAERAGSFDVSPDGQAAVWVRSRMDKDENGMVSNLVLTLLEDGKEVPLTQGKDRNRSPRWSPDGSRIAFLSDRRPEGEKGKGDEGRTQIWLLDRRGGAARILTKGKRSVQDFDWKDDDTLVFVSREDPPLYEQEAKKTKDDSEAVEDAAHEPPVRLFSVSIESGKVRRLTRNHDWIRWVAVSPDGRWALSLHQKSLSFRFDNKVPPVLVLTDLTSGESKEPFAGRRILVSGVTWARDSKGFYFVREHSSDPVYFTATEQLAGYYDLARAAAQDVDLDWPKGLARSGLLATGDGFLALLADGVRFQPARYVRSGDAWKREPLTGTQVPNLFGWALSRDGKTLVYEYSTASTPAQWYRATLEGARLVGEKRITHLNPSFEKKPIPRTEVVQWKGAKGEEVDGILSYPVGYQEGKRYPLMLAIHGGPTGADLDAFRQSWAYPKLLVNQAGAFTLQVNYHGSGNYGLAWAESICCGRYYELERVDLENGVDEMVRRGLADPDRLGSMGWSNGAILTTELVTRSHRYKVASVGAGDVEWISDWGNVDFGASFDNYYFGAAPWENPELYLSKSPYFRLKDDATPTILYTGTADRNVPPSQSWSHFRVLQQVGKTPVRFILFPGEPHGPRKYVHQKRKVEEDMAWFDRYLFHPGPPPDEALKKGSPLERALKQAAAARSGLAWGVVVKGSLTPEFVRLGALEVSRFEVTRAQWKAFDPDATVAPGSENLPVTGVGFEKAKAYVAWLSKRLGTTCRLPSAADAKALYTGARDHQNTLDYWAGYAVNPDDARALAAQAAKLGPGALLRPVGEFTGRGDDPVFDLEGNAAEWTVGASGQGVLRGGSADRPADPKASGDAGDAYRGLRVLRGSPPSS